MILDPVIPIAWIAFIALVALIVTAWFYFRSGRRLGAGRNLFLLGVRLAAIAVIIFLLLQPSKEEKVVLPVVEKSVLFAVDTSASMREPHSTGASRIDAVRTDLEKSGVLADSRLHRFFTFGETAAPTTPEALSLMSADDPSTRIDSSITTLLRMANQPQPAALFLLSDGHDFELTPPAETARRARNRGIPIFAVPYGTDDSARDVSIRIASYHPHTFVRQTTQLEVFIRSTGCPHETLNVELMRDDKVVERKSLNTGTESFHNLSFSVSHEEPGQFEYAFRIAPVANEKELSNNTATTYLNVISERIRILEIEGKPFWDSTFLRRSFARNDKFDIDSLVAFTGERVRPIRSNPDHKEEDLKPPAKLEDLMPYNMVVLGREAERVIGTDGLQVIEKWVKERGGILIFSRGAGWTGEIASLNELEPIHWETSSARGVRLEVTPQAGSVSAFRLLREVSAADEFPEVIAFPSSGPPKTLSATFSVAGDQSPAVVYRRYGSGQTLSLGVGNLWRWVFNPRAEYDNNAYDRFWDQLALWLLSNGGMSPIEGYSLRAETANVPLGEVVRLRLSARGKELPATPPTIEILKDNQAVTNVTMSPGVDDGPMTADFTPRDTGRYAARLTIPGAQQPLTARFMVFRDQLESIETSLDRHYLEQLAKATGGQLIDSAEIGPIAADLLRGSGEQPPLVRRIPLWDRPWVYILICFLLASDWYARRRWGLT